MSQSDSWMNGCLSLTAGLMDVSVWQLKPLSDINTGCPCLWSHLLLWQQGFTAASDSPSFLLSLLPSLLLSLLLSFPPSLGNHDSPLQFLFRSLDFTQQLAHALMCSYQKDNYLAVHSTRHFCVFPLDCEVLHRHHHRNLLSLVLRILW